MDGPTRVSGCSLWPQIDAQGEDAIDQVGLGVADHGVVGEVLLGLLAEALPLGTLDGGDATGAHCLGPLAEAGHHLLGVEHLTSVGRAGSVLGARSGTRPSERVRYEVGQPPMTPRRHLVEQDPDRSHYTGPAVKEVRGRTKGWDAVVPIPG